MTILVQRGKMPVHPPPPPLPVPMTEVFVVIQRDIDTSAGSGGGGGGGVAVSALHGAYADRRCANQAARKVLRLVGGGLDAVGRIRCKHEENMNEEGLYAGIAHVGEAERSRVEVVVERLDVK